MTPPQPHIILIIADQYRADCLGYAGNPIIKTPNLDALAQNGIYFSSAYSSTPSCTPARAALLTGFSPWHHGMLGYGKVSPQYQYEMPQMLRNAGYYTFGIGKMHWHPQRVLHGFHGTLLDESGRVESIGFISDYRQWFKDCAPGLNPDATGIGWNDNTFTKYALDEKLHPTTWTGDQAVKKIKDFDLSTPLFLKVSFARPHSPYDPPERFHKQYNWEDIPVPVIGDWTDEFKKYKHISSPYWGNFGVEHAQKARQHYYANVTFIDEQIGRIITELKNKGMYDNTLIIFTADHGDMLGDHYHWRKTYAYEGSAKIPFIMKWPASWKSEFHRGTQNSYPVELRDVLPTFLDAAGVTIPDDMDGKSLLFFIREQTPKWREYIDLEHSTCYHRKNYWLALTDGKMKYIYFRSTGKEQLFDLVNDPHELKNLCNEPQYQSILVQWRVRLCSHLQERGDKWVKKGKLQKARNGMLYSPLYPGKN